MQMGGYIVICRIVIFVKIMMSRNFKVINLDVVSYPHLRENFPFIHAMGKGKGNASKFESSDRGVEGSCCACSTCHITYVPLM